MCRLVWLLPSLCQWPFRLVFEPCRRPVLVDVWQNDVSSAALQVGGLPNLQVFVEFPWKQVVICDLDVSALLHILSAELNRLVFRDVLLVFFHRLGLDLSVKVSEVVYRPNLEVRRARVSETACPGVDLHLAAKLVFVINEHFRTKCVRCDGPQRSADQDADD